MATDFLGSLFGGAVSAAISTGAQAALQDQVYRQNLELQSRSFQHDERMLSRQVQATQAVRAQWMDFQRQALVQSGFSAADATRMVLGVAPTTLIDWNGPRIAAASSRVTTSYSGGFLPPNPIVRGTPRTNSTIGSLPNSSAQSGASTVSSWLSRSEPFMPGALQTVWVAPPGSTSTSVYGPSRAPSTRSTSSSTSGASYTSSFNLGWFNTDRLPLFANSGRRF
ncbi:small basic protein [Jena virus]|uniref:Small basic protein n=1 Tax=Jena virus TaxID=2847810 RepID=Q9YQ21_NORV|nr:small basic protein [Jena virus]